MSLIDTLLTLYELNKQNNTPKTSTVTTPMEDYLFKQYQNAFENPSQQKQMLGSFGQQSLNGLNNLGNTSGFNFVSPILKGQQFAGGMQLPKFDFSKYNFGNGTGGKPTGQPGGNPSSGGGVGGTGGGGAGGGGDQSPLQFPDLPSGTGGTPSGGTADYLHSNWGSIGKVLELAGLPKGIIDLLGQWVNPPTDQSQQLPTKPVTDVFGNPIDANTVKPGGDFTAYSPRQNWGPQPGTPEWDAGQFIAGQNAGLMNGGNPYQTTNPAGRFRP
jgi:hypothetical protein